MFSAAGITVSHGAMVVDEARACVGAEDERRAFARTEENEGREMEEANEDTVPKAGSGIVRGADNGAGARDAPRRNDVHQEDA